MSVCPCICLFFFHVRSFFFTELSFFEKIRFHLQPSQESSTLVACSDRKHVAVWKLEDGKKDFQ